MMMGAEFLKDKIRAVEVQMTAKLEEARATFAHSGDKGTSVEEAFRSFLRLYLPRRLEVGQGEVVDRGGRRSKQTDVVVANEDHPFTFTRDLPGLFFIEGVSAAGEVRSSLTSEGLEGALSSSVSFKKLETRYGRGEMINTNPSDRARFYRCPPWFLMAFESQLSLPTIHSRIVEFERAHAVEQNRFADAVFVLEAGSVINFGDGQGALKFTGSDGKPRPGWVVRKSDCVLYDLLSWLCGVMPRVLRFRPILVGYLVAEKPEER